MEEHTVDTLFEAILDKDDEKVAECISRGSTALSKNSHGDMAIHFACLNSNIGALKLLKETLGEGDIDTINVEEDDTICGTALHMAMDGQVDDIVVKTLLDWGANPNAADAKGMFVLHELIYRSWEDFQDDFKSEESMWEDDNIEETDCQSTENSQVTGDDCVQGSDDYMGQSYFRKLSMLVKFGADVNLQHRDTGMSPYHFWCQNLHWHTESRTGTAIPTWCHDFHTLILNAGADPNVVNNRGETPLYFLAQRHYKPNDELFKDSYRELVCHVLPNVSDFNMTNMFGRTLLHCAVEHSNDVFVRLLLQYSPDVNTQDIFGLSVIHLVTHNVTYSEAEFVERNLQALISSDASINIQDNHGLTPLHHALCLNNLTAIRVLLQANALTDVHDNERRTVLDIARILEREASLNVFDCINVAEDSEMASDCINETCKISINESESRKNDHSTGDEDARNSGTKSHEPSKVERQNMPISAVPVVSDISRGWYFQLCCHKQYKVETAWCDHRENVKQSSIDAWLEKYPMCAHNRRTVLQNAASDLATNTEQVVLDMRDEQTMKKEIHELAARVSRIIASFNPMFESRVIFGGSVSEGTKIGAFDEFDLVFDLWKLREYGDIVEPESDKLKGFVKLKINKMDEFTQNGMQHLVDEDGFLNRVSTSVEFHKYFERALLVDDVWCGTSYSSFWGTTNTEGECTNIGQLNLVWYGPWFVRQDVSVDVAPIIKISGWHPGNDQTYSHVKIVDQEVVKAIGCYLMMKDVSRYIDEQDKESMDSDEENISDEQTQVSLFKVSISQVEHATMCFLPPAIKMGYKIAKSIQLQCPVVLFLLEDIFMDGLSFEDLAEVDKATGVVNGTHGVVNVREYITSYVLKTGLFHELHRRNIRVTFTGADVHPDQWNSRIIDEFTCKPGELTKSDVTEAVEWATGIYKRLLAEVQQHGKIVEYFLPEMEATKISSEFGAFTKIASTFLKTLVYLLERFDVPDDLAIAT